MKNKTIVQKKGMSMRSGMRGLSGGDLTHLSPLLSFDTR